MSRKKNDEPMIACPSCGVENRIASPFCKVCGDRIYKHGASPSPENTSKEPSRGAKAFRSAINSLLFLAVVAVIGLAFWPYASLSVPQGSDPDKQVERYLAIVEQEGIENGKQLPVARISQGNLNAYLGQNNDEDTSKLLGVVLSAPELELIANEPIGPFHLSTRVVVNAAPAEDENPVSLFWVGHLPLPPFWATPWTRSLSKRFDLGIEPGIWDHLKIQAVEGKSVLVTFEP